MHIRRLTPDDVDAYFPLRLEGLERAPKAFGRSAEEYRLEQREQIAAWLSGDGDNFTLGAFKQDVLVGTAAFVRQHSLKTRHKGVVVAVYVSEAAQGTGVGKALMTELITQVREILGVELLTLAVATTQDAARRLYRSLGFQVFGVEKRALKVGLEYVDEEHMVLDFCQS